MKHLIDMAELDKSEIIGLMDEADRFREALEAVSYTHLTLPTILLV